MEEKLKLMLFKIIYDKLELVKIENKLKEVGIKPKKIVNEKNYPLISNYYFLNNEVNFDWITLEEKNKMDYYIDNFEKLNDEEMLKFEKFLNDNLLKFLIPEDSEGYRYWGPINDDYCAPKDSIVLALHYIEFDEENPLTDEQEDMIFNCSNYIQENSVNKGLKVAVLHYNECPIGNRNMMI